MSENEMEEWELIATEPQTWRLALPNGYLYRVGRDGVTFAPDIVDAMIDIASCLDKITKTFEVCTYNISDVTDGRAFRTRDIS